MTHPYPSHYLVWPWLPPLTCLTSIMWLESKTTMTVSPPMGAPHSQVLMIPFFFLAWRRAIFLYKTFNTGLKYHHETRTHSPPPSLYLNSSSRYVMLSSPRAESGAFTPICKGPKRKRKEEEKEKEKHECHVWHPTIWKIRYMHALLPLFPSPLCNNVRKNPCTHTNKSGKSVHLKK